MNEVEYMLMQDNREKKSAGRGIYHKRSGSKTKYCGLPSDHLTPAQLKRRNGPMQTYNISKVITSFEDFKALPVDLAKEYIIDTQFRYNVSMAQIASTMGVGDDTLKRYCRDHFDGKPYLDKRGPRTINPMWEDFCKGRITREGRAIEAPAPEPEAEPIPAPEVVDTPMPVTPEPARKPDVTVTPGLLAFWATGTPNELLDLINLAFVDMVEAGCTYKVNLMLSKEGVDD